MMKILFGTHNAHKAKEVAAMLGPEYQLVTAAELGLADVDETGTTLAANAVLKATQYAKASGLPTFADDTGLEVTALGGAPGVYSARYAGEHGNAAANMDKLLAELEGAADRTARFRTVIAYVDHKGDTHTVEGELQGHIMTSKEGIHGFGYDPIFCPAGHSQSLATFSATEKNAISHRGHALRAFVALMKTL